MNRFVYGEIVLRYLFPFVNEKYKNNCLIHQDNDTKHNSKYCQSLYRDFDLRIKKAPAKSPDLNPIEKLWSSLKAFVAIRRHSIIEDLKESVGIYWSTKVTPYRCRCYIRSIKKAIKQVILNKGGWSNT